MSIIFKLFLQYYIELINIPMFKNKIFHICKTLRTITVITYFSDIAYHSLDDNCVVLGCMFGHEKEINSLMINVKLPFFLLIDTFPRF
jgi:hypothetical protein